MGQPTAPIIAHQSAALIRRLAMLLAIIHLIGKPPEHANTYIIVLGAGLVAGRGLGMLWLRLLPQTPGLMACAGLIFTLVGGCPGNSSFAIRELHLFMLALGCELGNTAIDNRRRNMIRAIGWSYSTTAAWTFIAELILGLSLSLSGLTSTLEWALPGWHLAAAVVLGFMADAIGFLWAPAEPHMAPNAIPWPDSDEARSLVWSALAAGLALTSKMTLSHQGVSLQPTWTELWPVAIGLVLGALPAAIFSAPPRQQGWFPLAGMIAICGLGIMFFKGESCWGSRMLLAIASGLALAAARSTALPRGNARRGPRLLRLAAPFAIATLIILLFKPLDASTMLITCVVGMTIFTLASIWFLRQSFVELVVQVGLTPMYRIEAVGPGLSRFPDGEPVLLIANHTAYADPFWLGSAIRHRFYPMMTSTFYDLPFVSFMMRRVVGAIRVPAGSHRKDAPELKEASALLASGKCVLIFPEATLRRVPEPVMRRFGRGVALLLAEHPNAWVVPAWIEGGWGSYFSNFNGPPMTGKPIDFWRTIRIGIGEPRKIDPALLANHLKTRAALQQAVYDCRGLLGLDIPLAPPVVESQSDSAD